MPTPISLQQHALPFTQKTHLSADMGIYAQDKWTIQRATINAGVRFDYFKNNFPEQVLGPASFVPNRNIVIPETPYANMKDITPRVGVAYDLFGNGKTSLRSSWGKYMIGLSPLAGNPISLLAYTANRSWTDANGNYNPELLPPQCKLSRPARERRRFLRRAGQRALRSAPPQRGHRPGHLSRDGVTGRGTRNSPSASSRRLRRASRWTVGYFRRWFGNFTVVDNRAVGPSDFTRYSITAPVDSRLELSGQTISGLYDQTGNIGTVDNYTTFADNYGKQIEHWNGIDFTVNARPRDGVVLQGGFNVGRTTIDNCDLRASLPEITILPAGRRRRDKGQPATIGLTAIPDSQCHVDTAFLPQYKFLGTYLVPKIDVQFGVTYQATPGPEIAANYVVTPSQTTPAVPLNGGLRLVNVVDPGQEFVKHIQQLDLRISKILKMGRTRAVLSVDLANLLNANYTQTITTAYGSRWLAPTSIMDPRLVKLGAQFDF